MNDKELFYEKIKQEYDEFMELWLDWDADSVIGVAEYIGDLKQIYEYLMRDKPIDENSYLEHYMKLNKPLQTICDLYQEEKTPIYDSLNHTLWNIGDQQIYGDDFSEEKYLLLKRLDENYAEMVLDNTPKDRRNPDFMMLEYVKHHIEHTDDADVRTLLQFKNPLKLMIETPNIEGQFDTKMAKTAQYVRMSDVLTLPYEKMDENTEEFLEAADEPQGGMDLC